MRRHPTSHRFRYDTDDEPDALKAKVVRTFIRDIKVPFRTRFLPTEEEERAAVVFLPQPPHLTERSGKPTPQYP